MRSKKIQKNIAGILLAVELTIFPFVASAQLGNLNPVSTNDAGSTAQNTAFTLAMIAPKSAYVLCVKAVETGDTADSSLQLGFSGLSLIGGDSVLMARMAAKISLYQTFITCASGAIDLADKVSAPNAYVSNQKQNFISQITASIQAYKVKLESVQARYNNAKQGFWKTLVVNILIKTSKSVANALVNKLLSNYKIKNVVGYVDSVATLMYDNQFIRANFPNSSGQFMARAILENPQVRYKVPSSAFVAADAALGFDPKAISPNDPDYYIKMAGVGSATANPYFQHTITVAGVDQARATSVSYAQNQVAQSNGLKTPVTCGGTLAQQKATDMQYKSVSDKFDNRWALYRDLQQAKDLGKNVPEADMVKAKADFESAQKAYQNFPTQVSTSSAASIICESIVSPAIMINKGIDQAFEAFGAPMKQYNDNNLPGFMNLIGDVASQIGTSLVFGGLDGAKNTAVINEGRLVNGSIAAATDYAYSNASDNLAKGIDFSYDKDSNFDDGYDLSWTINTDLIPTANFVTVSGDGISSTKIDATTKLPVTNKLGLTQKAIIHTKVGGTYILTVFDANGKALTASAKLNIAVDTSQAYNSSSNNQTAVLGAYTDKASLDVRGPVIVIQPRGP